MTSFPQLSNFLFSPRHRRGLAVLVRRVSLRSLPGRNLAFRISVQFRKCLVEFVASSHHLAGGFSRMSLVGSMTDKLFCPASFHKRRL
jgi:hypothetical protein